MSTPSTLTMPGRLMGNPAQAQRRPMVAITGLTLGGVVLFFTSLFVMGSGFTGLRPMVMGLALHPYLLPIGLMCPFVLMSRIHLFPMRILVGAGVFCAMYVFSVFNGGSFAVGEVFKLACSVMTVLTCALMVRKRGDFLAGALGLSIAIAALAARGLTTETSVGVEAIQGANRNSYSLFALPAILLAGFIAVRLKDVPNWVKTALIVCTIPALAAIFMSGNRSGYLGSVLIGLMLFWDRRGRGTIIVAAVAGAVMLFIMQFGSGHMFDERMKQTIEGNKSDDERKDIIATCLEIGLENPVIGVSPQLLHFEIGRKLGVKYNLNYIEAHNVFAHVFAGSGVICFLSLLGAGWCMWTWKPHGKVGWGDKEDPLRDARRLVKMTVVLWAVRGIFTREIMFSPSFNILLGLTIGFCLLSEIASQQYRAEKADQGSVPSPPTRPEGALAPVRP